MDVVLANEWLEVPGGTETYSITVADHLQRLGHEVWLYCNRAGRVAEQAREEGVRVVASGRELPEACDVVISQDQVLAADLAARYPGTPQAFVAHSEMAAQLPPLL